MDEAYKAYVKQCWVWSRETCISLADIGEYDEAIILAIFNKVCQPYHYWKNKK